MQPLAGERIPQAIFDPGVLDKALSQLHTAGHCRAGRLCNKAAFVARSLSRLFSTMQTAEYLLEFGGV